MKVPKLEAGARQLDTAIRLYFAKGDAVAVHSLAASAWNVLADVADATRGTSWREHVREDSKLTEREAKKILNQAWNFFKHGDEDPVGVLDFDEVDTESLLFMATVECKDVYRNTLAMDTYQVWYVATRPDRFPSEKLKEAKEAFAGVVELDRESRIERGAAFLRMVEAQSPAKGR